MHDVAAMPVEDAPLYRLVADRIRRDILSGSIAPGDPIASEQQLVAAHGVSRITIRRALDELSREGLLERRQGRTTRVRRLEGMRPIAGEQRSDISNLLALASATQVDVLEAGLRPVTGDVAAQLGIPAGTPTFFCRRIRLHRGLPFCTSDAWIPARFAARMNAAALATHPILSLMADAGAHPVRTDQAIAAVAARAGDAESLDVAPGSPLLEVTRVLHDSGGQPVQHLTMLFRSDRYRYYMTLLRGQEGSEAGMLV